MTFVTGGARVSSAATSSTISPDKLTYAENLENLKDVEDRAGYRFVESVICNRETVAPLVAESDYTRRALLSPLLVAATPR